MKSLKDLSPGFTGELHDVHLVNFSIDPAELDGQLPAGVRPLLWNGRALISMVDVHLRNMKAQALWFPFRFHYQHVAFRLLVHPPAGAADQEAGYIYFLKSFTSSKLITSGGQLLTDYHLQSARLQNFAGGLRLESEGKFLEYNLDGPVTQPNAHGQQLKALVAKVDRALSIRQEKPFVTQIQREKWPLLPMHCNDFRTDFFHSAKLEGVFRVPETIYYQWLPAKEIA